MGRPQSENHSRRPIRRLPLNLARRKTDRPVERRHRLLHGSDGPHHPLAIDHGLPYAGILRTCELRLQGPLHFRGERPRRRFVALRVRPSLGILPLCVGRMAHQRGVVLHPGTGHRRQPQIASFGRQSGQSAGIRLCLHRADQHRQSDELYLRRTGKSLLCQRHGSALVGSDVGNRNHLRRRTRRRPSEQSSQFHRRLLYPRYEGHAHHFAHAAQRLRRQYSESQLRRPAHKGLGDIAELARRIPTGGETLLVPRIGFRG